MHKRNIKELGLPVLTFFVVVIGWEIVDYVFAVKEVILPNPHEIFFSVISNLSKLSYHTGITMLESVLGFAIGTIVSILVAVLFTYSSSSKKALYPYAIALKATPLYALAPLLVIWFGNGIWAKVVMSSMVAFFPVLVSATKGFGSVQEEALDLFRSLNASNLQVFTKLRVPNSLSYIFPSLKIASTLAVVGATIAEFTGASYGVGHLIVSASYYLDTSLMFASIICISLGGILFFYIIDYIEKKIVFWQ